LRLSVLSRIRYFLSDSAHRAWGHRLVSAGILVAVLAAAGGVYLAVTSDSDDVTLADTAPLPVPPVVVQDAPEPEDTGDLGFPAFATKNTTRVAGADPIANAAAVSLAVYPSTGDAPGPDAVTVVDAADWAAGVAAASLAAEPVGAPLLVTESDEVPPLTDAALRELGPEGSAATAGRQVFVVGAAATPQDYETLEVEGVDPAEVAAEIARLRERLAGEPEAILVASSDEPAYAMPAAGWAARSGDPVLFTATDSLDPATEKALRQNDGVPVFVLGPEAAISEQTMKEIERVARDVERVGAEGPVENAIAFARYVAGGFGWNINDPGHGFVIVNADRPLDAAAAAPLSGSGTWGPALVSGDSAALPEALHGYLLDLKPGYEDDPTRAVYNHVWLIGDTSALSVGLQAEVDELAEVAPVTSGSGSESGSGSGLGPAPGAPESQPDEPTRDQDQ
jgi:hypothetical protein